MPGDTSSMLQILNALSPEVLLTSASALQPWLIFAISVMGGVAMVLALPGRKKASWARIGALLMVAASGVLIASLVRFTAGSPGGLGGASYVYFWLFAILALVGSVRVITHPQPVYSALYFVLTVFASAGLFVMLWAEFMAAALVLIYAGAILVTYVFVIMLAAEASPARPISTSGALAVIAEHDQVSREPVAASIAGFAILGLLLFVIFDRDPGPIERHRWSPPPATVVVPASEQFQMASDVAPAPTDAPKPVVTGNSQELGYFLFKEHLVGLQIAGLLLTLSMIGAIVIARKKVILPSDARPATADVMTGPATPVDDNPHSIPVVGTMDPAQKGYPEN